MVQVHFALDPGEPHGPNKFKWIQNLHGCPTWQQVDDILQSIKLYVRPIKKRWV